MTEPGRFVYDFPRPAVTVDLVLLTTEAPPRVLLIRRAKEPFAGAWALPGGFVDANEPLESAARRELQEETGLTAGSLDQLHAFGDPGRDPRGWTVSIVFLGRVDPSAAPRAGDDAVEAAWFPLDALPPLAFDHGAILDYARQQLSL